LDRETGKWKMESLDPIVRFTKLTGADLLVKGSHDMIATSHGHSLNEHISHHPIHIRYNRTGVPEMSVGGTGDVLAGLCAGFMAKGMTAFDSGCVAAYVNGKAGEMTRRKIGISLSASKILDQISSVLSSS
jgi:NAD(P)H-hydrate repair Nnr-like enzyme with NAD(P)H-hydrate dehydratase domain